MNVANLINQKELYSENLIDECDCDFDDTVVEQFLGKKIKIKEVNKSFISELDYLKEHTISEASHDNDYAFKIKVYSFKCCKFAFSFVYGEDCRHFSLYVFCPLTLRAAKHWLNEVLVVEAQKPTVVTIMDDLAPLLNRAIGDGNPEYGYKIYKDNTIEITTED